ncbi:hypothetical protein HYPSUDRAFT_65934 [Hypholoma sublateritium FD-334 SS-4]|uniref:Uncharacterized protein n=1 Tax=Hypholoma sublateritium (strain FD-334 SS-4) TaxID=945553 RepID=A0A0D2L9B9_HYPSF|nr:hypothetical protein HYPSUDRAFT_65934 [Hypholoma sublateritium FD-334 SS-4]
MGSVCFSSASILRCTPITSLQSILLIIPTALEVIFSSSLIFANLNGGRKHLLLTAEGWIYLILSLLELIRTIVPGVQNNVALFQGFDIGIGVASFLPIFFYTFFLFLFTNNDLGDALPRSIRNIAKLSLILFLPTIVVFNEVASFVGVKIGTILPSQENTSSRIAGGFTNSHEELLWTFFTSTTLALLIVYQAAVFCISFFRLARAIINQRRIEKEGSDKAHFTNGMGWICIALKLGALESVVGFAGGAFGADLTRRIMRMAARGFLCIGIVKGVDTTEDFHVVQRELNLGKVNSRNAKAGLRNMISNPRFSSFRQLSPTATAFHAAHSTNAGSEATSREKSDPSASRHYSTWSQRQSRILQTGLPGMQTFATVKQARSKQRVTVQYKDGTPRLHMRFSSLDSLTRITEKIDKRPQSDLLDRYQGQTVVQLPYASDYPYSENGSELQVPAAPWAKDAASSISYRDSMNSAPSPGLYEIVDARKLGQRVAVAQIYQAPSGIAPRDNASLVDTVTFPEPVYQAPSAKPARPGRTASKVVSVADTIKAVRELTGQFPGPPGISQLRPTQNANRSLRELPESITVQPSTPPVVEKSVWEEDSRASAQYLSGIPVPQVIGSPSQLSYTHDLSTTGADENIYGGMQSGDVSPARAGKVPVTPGGYSRISTVRSRSISMQKPIDPFTDDGDGLRPTRTPTHVPVGMPLRQSLRLNMSALPKRYSSRAATQPIPNDIETPSTPFSQIVRLQDSAIESHVEPFVDFTTALDTGKSWQFRPNLSPVPQAPAPRRMSTIPTPTRKMSSAQEKLSRITQWVDTSANLAVVEADPEIPTTPTTIVTPTLVDSPFEVNLGDAPRSHNSNLQNLHDRGPSIDALSIRWPRQPDGAKEARAPGGAVADASAPGPARPQLTRITTVGKAPSRTTPTPMHSMHTHTVRGSLHLQPIVVPPRNGKLPEIEYEFIESPVSGNVLDDSDVLNLEDSLRILPRQAARRF